MGRLVIFEVNETVAARLAIIISGDFARKDVAEKGKGIIQGLVVNGLVEVLHEHVGVTSLPQSGVPVRPHNTALLASDGGVVQGVQSTLSIGHVVEVDVGVTKRTASDRIPADANRGNGTDTVEDLIEHSFSDIGLQVANVKGGELSGRLLLLLLLSIRGGLLGDGGGGILLGDSSH